MGGFKMLKQKSFQVNENDWNILYDISRIEKKSISEIVRNLIKNFINEKEKNNINLYLKKHCKYTSHEEEQEIIKTLKNKKSFEFIEVKRSDL
jgi:Holliday junction resolvasome RuvABC DNA-binding subunit